MISRRILTLFLYTVTPGRQNGLVSVDDPLNLLQENRHKTNEKRPSRAFVICPGEEGCLALH